MKRLIVSLAALSICVAAANAQDLRTGFFLGNYLYGHNINPALRPAGASSFIELGTGVSVGFDSNVGVSSFLFPHDGGLVTGLNKNVPAEEFLGGLEDKNRVSLDLNYDLFSTGRYVGGGKYFLTFGAKLRSRTGLEVPKPMFEMLKSGGDGDRFAIRDLELSTRNYMELALGCSRKIDALTLGVTLKGLIGLAAAEMKVSELSAAIDGNVVNVTGNGTLRASLPVELGVDGDGNIDFTDIPDMDGVKVSGYGAAIDLGATYELLDGDLMLSASVTDLGAISWNNNTNGVLSSSNSFSVNDSDDAGDTLEDMLQFKSKETGENKASMLPAMVNLGAKYELPFVPGLGVGALCSFRMGNAVDRYTDLRVGASWSPGRVFSIAGTCGMAGGGFVYGAAANLRLACINVFAGIDGIPDRVTPQYVPVDSMSSVVKFGLALAFGKGHRN